MKDLVLVYQWCKNDNWYGQRYRAILSSSENVGFQTRTEINKLRTRFKNFIKKRFQDRIWELPTGITNKSLLLGERKEFVDYIHYSNGPSLYYKHMNFNLEDL